MVAAAAHTTRSLSSYWKVSSPHLKIISAFQVIFCIKLSGVTFALETSDLKDVIRFHQLSEKDMHYNDK